ncbi:PREDICTED: probable E3 ubiquitin-protein ligase HERC4 [Amphimedon queenslandica]|uniref:HECT domain-containing protein n=1 Tax=Amphimedon queenslandica TaxID=400682 RepID=A0A1X7VX72_AMPQE|nr:PREDICTED: probable E3 ubiquitin-protein ligase HERC4 [Amphimedon queenslandica]|eukprot:XP_019848779.1 PREDICTED: probable E3 ubiquitin-protein ligase HERC4 [Amphimedon queenslandica]
MFCWGEAHDGALGLDVKEKCVMEARPNTAFGDKKIKYIASSVSHTLILLESGCLYSCGSNQYGQLGIEQKTSCIMIPAHIDTFDDTIITSISCGVKHSLALSSDGSLYAWGDNSEGQLGLKTLQPICKPSILSLPFGRPVVQAACGDHHTLALTQDGRVFSWGKNTTSQLGHSKGLSRVLAPTQITHLISTPVVKLICGSNHSAALTVSGGVFLWGDNRRAQCGFGHVTTKISYPTLNEFMGRYAVSHVACGTDHTVFQVQSGHIYTVGSNEYGQLGRGARGAVYSRPAPIMQLMTVVVQQVVCGRYHTTLLAKYTGDLITFGQGLMGQLGNGTTFSSEQSIPVMGRWSSPKRYLRSPRPANSNVVKGVFAGGNHTFATILLPDQEEDLPVDFSDIQSQDAPCFLSLGTLKQMLDLARYTNDYTGTLQTLKMFFSSPSCVNGSFLLDQKRSSPHECRLDHAQLTTSFELLRERLSSHDIDHMILIAFNTGLLPNLPEPHPSPESLRIFHIILAYPLAQEYPACLSIIVTFVKVFLYISDKAKDIIESWLFNGPVEVLQTWIEIFRYPIARIIAGGRDRIEQSGQTLYGRPNLIHLTDDQTWALQEGIKVLRWLFECNKKHKEPVSHQKFYVDEIVESCDLREDYFSYKQNRVDRVLFMRYSFVLNASGKAELMQIEGRYRQMEAVAHAHHRNILNWFSAEGISDVSPMAFVINVRRDHILGDAITALRSHDTGDLLKPLRVQFEGEEGFDEGGVQKEFFMLLIRELLNPDFGMFYEEDESRYIWFRQQLEPIESYDRQCYHLVGMICALAIYNGVIVDLPFPPVLYRKLLSYTPSLKDLESLKPSVGKHLRGILTYDGNDFEKDYNITFEVTRNIYGSVITIPLKKEGASEPVTKLNKKEFVQLYVKYELTECIKEQFESFVEGFMKVCDIKSDVFLTLHPDELMALVSGSSSYDFNEFMEHTTYINGYTPSHPAIQSFWAVVNDFSPDAQKQLLIFWTGSNRIPVAGVKSLKLIIQRMDGGDNFRRLPVAHTCSNVLDLPPYPSNDLMKEKLLKAIFFTKGFGIL